MCIYIYIYICILNHFAVYLKTHYGQISYTSVKKREKGGSLRFSSGPAGGSVVKSPPASAGGTGESASQGRSHTPWGSLARVPLLLSLCSRVRELQPRKPSSPQALEPVLCDREASAMRSPRSTTRGKPAQQGRPSPAKYETI